MNINNKGRSKSQGNLQVEKKVVTREKQEKQEKNKASIADGPHHVMKRLNFKQAAEVRNDGGKRLPDARLKKADEEGRLFLSTPKGRDEPRPVNLAKRQGEIQGIAQQFDLQEPLGAAAGKKFHDRVNAELTPYMNEHGGATQEMPGVMNGLKHQVKVRSFMSSLQARLEDDKQVEDGRQVEDGDEPKSVKQLLSEVNGRDLGEAGAMAVKQGIEAIVDQLSRGEGVGDALDKLFEKYSSVPAFKELQDKKMAQPAAAALTAHWKSKLNLTDNQVAALHILVRLTVENEAGNVLVGSKVAEKIQQALVKEFGEGNHFSTWTKRELRTYLWNVLTKAVDAKLFAQIDTVDRPIGMKPKGGQAFTTTKKPRVKPVRAGTFTRQRNGPIKTPVRTGRGEKPTNDSLQRPVPVRRQTDSEGPALTRTHAARNLRARRGPLDLVGLPPPDQDNVPLFTRFRTDSGDAANVASDESGDETLMIRRDLPPEN